MIEIERKFIVDNLEFLEDTRGFRISQGYLNDDPSKAVRVRIKGKNGFISVKGKSNTSGTSRFEWEKEISDVEARELLKLCLPNIIDKTRYEIPYDGKLWEIDVFHGLNEGLIIAEIELNAEDEEFKKPVWLGEEVTGKARYYNSNLSSKPYTLW